MDIQHTRQCLALHALPGLSDASLAQLLIHFGSVSELWSSSIAHWAQFGAPPEAIALAQRYQGAWDKPCDDALEQQAELLQDCGAQVMALGDELYPPLLAAIYDPPPLLYWRGDADVLRQSQLALVGSRKASPAGKRAAQMMAQQAVTAGLHVCSGLALGIDGAAHSGALQAGGKTIAVMATGIDRVYPQRHRQLAEEAAAAGCLLTEYPLGAKPLPYRFPRRNRIISGLSLGVLVVEAAQKSGSLITASCALEQGREVFAIPHSIFHSAGQGCLQLLRQGATLVAEFEDILQELGPQFGPQPAVQQVLLEQSGSLLQNSETQLRNLPDEQALVLQQIDYAATQVDDIVTGSGLGIAEVLASLSALEAARLVSRSEGGFIRV